MTPEGDPTESTVDVAFQAMFAIITTALIAGAVADRMRFGAWLLYAGAWVTLVYFPVAHWVWGGGWLASLGALDFGGSLVIFASAGVSGLAVALLLRSRSVKVRTVRHRSIAGPALVLLGGLQVVQQPLEPVSGACNDGRTAGDPAPAPGTTVCSAATT